MFLSAKTERCLFHAYQYLMLFVIITALYFGQTNAACLVNDKPCPRDMPYCTEVGCVFECPDTYFANGTTCVWSCGDAITDLSQMVCAKTCPRPGMFIYSSAVGIGAHLRRQRVCHESCAQLFESDKIKLFIYKNTCVRACPDEAIYISNNTCVEDCSVGNVTMVTITAPDSNTTLGIECRLKRLCPNGTFYDQNNNGCVRECAGVLESGNCKDRCNQFMRIENGHCVEVCSPLHPIAKWKDESKGVSNYECVKDCGNNSYSYKSTCVVKGQCFYPVTLGGRKCSDTCPESHPYKIEDGCEKTCPLGYTLNKQSLQCESWTKGLPPTVIVSLLCLLYLIVFRSSLGDLWSLHRHTLRIVCQMSGVCPKRESDRTLVAEGRLSIDQSTNRIAENNQVVSTVVNIPDHPLECPDSQDLLGPTLQNMTRNKGRERRGSKYTIEEYQMETPLLDGKDHSEMGRVVPNTENESTALPIHSLLENEEEYHLFVCHSSEDQKVAWEIVKDLEQNGVKCMYSRRDFKIGQPIRANIENGINRSYRVLVLLSSNTEIGKSGWFDMELEVAYMRFMKKKRHALIPVMLEECNIPDTLDILTYIDGRQGDDVTADIVQELRRPGHKRKVVIDEVRDQNGIAFPIAVSNNEKLSGKVSFSSIVTQKIQRQLKQMGLSIPDQVLVRTLAILNESFAVKHQHLIDTRVNVRLHFTVYVGLLLCNNLASMLHWVRCSLVPETTSAPNIITLLVICMITMPIWVLSNRVHYILFQRDYKEAKKDLRRKLWKEVTEQFYTEKKYLLLYDDKFCLWITRYDTGPCRHNIKKYLRMVPGYVNLSDGQLEEAVDILIENIIVNYGEDVLHQLTVEQRHHKADEKCICQIVEDNMMDKGILSLSSLT